MCCGVVGSPHLGLQTSSQSRSCVIDYNQYISLDCHVKGNFCLSVLHLKIPGKRKLDGMKFIWKSCISYSTSQSYLCVNLLHPVILLWRGEDPLISYINLTEWPASITLLVEQRYRRHDNGINDYGLAMGDDRLLCHHVAHILHVPATIKSHN